MAFKECSFQAFRNDIQKEKKKIICYGAGMIPLYIEDLLRQQGLLSDVCLFLDGNSKKWGQKIVYQDRNVPVENPEILKSLPADKYVILVTAERYKEILDGLKQYVAFEEWDCYAYPLLNLSYFKGMAREAVGSEKNGSIPKCIHYTWFGKKEKQELHQRCIASWRKYCPDYEIIEWNENSYDVHKNNYISQAYKLEKWAYVSDFARLDILHKYGGIYFDMDVELIAPIDDLLHRKAFLCFGEWPAPNSGAGVGCEKGNKVIGEMMAGRETLSFLQKDGGADPHTNSNYEMKILKNYGFQMNFSYQNRDGFALLPPDMIAPASVTGRDSFVTERTLGIHYCNNSWRD